MPKQRLLRSASMVASFLLMSLLAMSQNKTITGKVTDEKGNAVTGATVIVKGSKTGTSTDASGSFQLNVSANAKTLVISYIGYTAQEVSIASSSDVSVSLKPEAAGLNDVVVVGYGTARKKDLTGAVAQISSKDFSTGNLQGPYQAIQGKVPGLVITLPGGDPNGNFSIRLRGQTSLSGGQSPLIVVDGVPLSDASEFANIPTSDIASIDILKDASASAIYGSRASNGVMVVVLKKGAAGKPVIEYNGSVSLDKVAKLYDMADAAQWKAGYTKLNLLSGKSQGSIDSSLAGFDHGGNTDWQKAMMRTGFSHNNSISVSGGGNGFSYRGSVNYLNQEGVVINSGKNQLGLRFSAQQKALDDRLTIQVGILYTNTNRRLTDYNTFYESVTAPPVYPVRNADGSYFGFVDFALQNPVQQQNDETNKAVENLTILNGTADYELIKGLKIGATGSYTHFNNQMEYFTPVFNVVNNVNVGALATRNSDVKYGNAHINYLKSFGKHNVTATLVYEDNVYTTTSYGAVSSNMLLDALGAWSLNSSPSQYQHSYSSQDYYNVISYLGRVTYNYDQRYFLTGSLREDGSSKFGPKYAHGYFPSISAAWRINRESFMRDVTWLDDLKLNVGWGVTGDQDNISPYSKLQLYGKVGSYYDASKGLWLTAYGPTQNANPSLQWEKRIGRNIGLDFAVLNRRLSGNITYFNDQSEKLLYDYTIPFPSPGSVVNTLLANVGGMSHHGIEVSLNYDVVRHKDFTWSLSGQISTVTERITSLSGSYNNGQTTFDLSTDLIPQGAPVGRGLSTTYATYLKVGYVPDVFYLAHYLGLDKNGNEMYDSAGGTTTTFTNASKHFINPAPKFTYGFSSNFTYKAWALGLFFRGVAGAKIYDNTRLILDNINRFAGNNATVEGLTNGIINPPQPSDHWVENASYLRLDNLNLSYTFNQVAIFRSLKIYLAANNVFVITKYRGLDPEVKVSSGTTSVLQTVLGSSGVANTFSQGGSTGTQAYIDASYGGDGYYPKTHSYTFGVAVTFK